MYDIRNLKKGDIFYEVYEGSTILKCRVTGEKVKSKSEPPVENMVVEWKTVWDKREEFFRTGLKEPAEHEYYFDNEKEAREYYNKSIEKLGEGLDNIEILLRRLYEKAYGEDNTMESFLFAMAIEKYIGSLKEKKDV